MYTAKAGDTVVTVAAAFGTTPYMIKAMEANDFLNQRRGDALDPREKLLLCPCEGDLAGRWDPTGNAGAKLPQCLASLAMPCQGYYEEGNKPRMLQAFDCFCTYHSNGR
jgi:hypothetical protein